MSKIYLTIALALSLAIGGWQINKQRDIITDLQAQIEQVEATREMELAHFSREIERLETVRMYELMQKDFSHEATNDKSDTGSDMFGVSRVMRVNKFNF